MKRIVVGVDGSEGSRVALQWALEEAAATGSEVVPVLAYDVGLAWIDIGSDYEASMIKRAAEKAHREIHAVVDALDTHALGVTLHPLVIEGLPPDALVEAARGAELLVVGSRGRGGFAGLLLGSVSQRCVERSPCPVVVVPPSGRG
jgi:nucleotide-binding universal stress UspA family protein